MLFKRAGASFETVGQSTISDRVPRDYKPSRQLQITFDGKLFKPSSPIEVYNSCVYFIQEIFYIFDFNYYRIQQCLSATNKSVIFVHKLEN